MTQNKYSGKWFFRKCLSLYWEEGNTSTSANGRSYYRIILLFYEPFIWEITKYNWILKTRSIGMFQKQTLSPYFLWEERGKYEAHMLSFRVFPTPPQGFLVVLSLWVVCYFVSYPACPKQNVIYIEECTTTSWLGKSCKMCPIFAVLYKETLKEKVVKRQLKISFTVLLPGSEIRQNKSRSNLFEWMFPSNYTLLLYKPCLTIDTNGRCFQLSTYWHFLWRASRYKGRWESN